jgi:putative ABC transport system permease protein
MGFYQSCKLALDSIMKSKVRAFLTMLGIIIGVAAVTVIVGMGNGMTNYITDSFESMGTNLITVNIQGEGASRTVSVDDMYALVKANPDTLAHVSPTVYVGGSVKIGNKTLNSTSITGVSEDYIKIKSSTLTSGRYFQYIDVLRLQNVCVLGSYIASTYYHGNIIGETLKINGNVYTIIGILKTESQNTRGSSDDAIFIPYTNAEKLSKSAIVTSYSFSGTSDAAITQASAIIDKALFEVFKTKDYYYIMSLTEILKQATQMINVVVIVLGAIAAISLFVGGIGIMNIMLISVTERTREIGIRKSLGAKRRDIMQQFVIEAATTSALGGIIGIGFGYLLSTVATKVMTQLMTVDIKVSPSSTAVLAAFSVSVAIGIIFGYLPAKKAAQLNPIDALRYD